MGQSGLVWVRLGLMGMGVMAVSLFGLFLFLGWPGTAAATPQGNSSAFLPLIISPSGDCYFTETNDAVVIEVESIPAVDQWQLQTGFPDYTGSGYYVWTGPGHLGQPGIAILTYPIHLTKSGIYRLNVRNSHPLSPTDFNDVWVRLDDRPWVKGFSNIVDTWTYDFSFDYGGGILMPADFPNVQAGQHTLQLSARSPAFRIDRIVLSTNGMGQLDTWPESPCVPAP